jgi:LAO/AO transport system kinase
MDALSTISRRAISKELSQVANASVAEILAMPAAADDGHFRIGITGAPGAGKSSLTARLVPERLLKNPGHIAVLAVDPTSPHSGGALLGDRIRMDALSAESRVFIRSLASRGSVNGLADNLPDIAAVFERHGFSELFIETVGVGQVDYEVRRLVDTTVLILMPGAGDRVQAMKCGILEVADILVVNKADLPGAAQLRAELESIANGAGRGGDGWKPRVVSTSMHDPASYKGLSESISQHQDWLSTQSELAQRRRSRRIYYASMLLHRRIDEAVRDLEETAGDQAVSRLFHQLAACIAAI